MLNHQNKRPSVLLADDDSLLRAMLKLILRSENYPVLGEVANGEDAVTQFAKLKPDLLLLDINMPKMDGLQVLEAIHSSDPDAMVMMVSADATMDRVTVALSLGAVGFVVKPFNPASVLNRIEHCCKERGWIWQSS